MSTTASASLVSGRRLAVLTVLLSGLTAFGPLSMDLYQPAFPRLAEELGTGTAGVQFTLTADVLGLVIGQLVLGPLSDAHGRRSLLIGSTVACALASLLCASAPNAVLLSCWRFVQGAAGGGGIVLARAVAADLTSGVAAARLFSLFMTLSSVAPIVAPVLGGVLLEWTGSWRVMFYVLAGTSAALAATTWRWLPETLPSGRRHTGGLRTIIRGFVMLSRDRIFAGYALTVFFAYASLFGYIAGSSFVLQGRYGVSSIVFSLIFAGNAAGMIGLGLLNARLVRTVAVRRLLIVGLVGSSVAAVLLVIAVLVPGWGIFTVLPPLFVVVASRGLVSANATVLGVQQSPIAGSASAILGACMFMGGIVVSPILAIDESSALPMAGVVAGGAVLALWATAFLTRDRSSTRR